MNTLTKTAFLSLILLVTSACNHMQGRHYSLPIEPIENSPLKISIIDGTPVAILNGEVISSPANLPHDFVINKNNEPKPISLQSIEQFTLIRIKGSCLYFSCAGSQCTQFEVPDEYCP